MSEICDEYKNEGPIMGDTMTEPDTLRIVMTRGERRIADVLRKLFGGFKRVVIDVDDELHEFSADSLIQMLEDYEGARDMSRYEQPAKPVADELKACPFCKGEASKIEAWQKDDGTYHPAMCGCRSCGIWRYGERDYGHDGFATEEDFERSMEQAVSKWNTRSDSGECENVSDPPEGFLCSSCGWGDFTELSHLLTTAKYAGRVEGGPNFCPNCGAKVKAVKR